MASRRLSAMRRSYTESTERVPAGYRQCRWVSIEYFWPVGILFLSAHQTRRYRDLVHTVILLELLTPASGAGINSAARLVRRDVGFSYWCGMGELRFPSGVPSAARGACGCWSACVCFSNYHVCRVRLVSGWLAIGSHRHGGVGMYDAGSFIGNQLDERAIVGWVDAAHVAGATDLDFLARQPRSNISRLSAWSRWLRNHPTRWNRSRRMRRMSLSCRMLKCRIPVAKVLRRNQFRTRWMTILPRRSRLAGLACSSMGVTAENRTGASPVIAWTIW